MMLGETLYQWQGYDQNQQLNSGYLLAKSKAQAQIKLSAQQIIPLQLKSFGYFSYKQFTPFQLMLLTRQLAIMLQAGLPLVNSLQLLAKEHPKACWRFLLLELATHISLGQSFSQTLSLYPIFPDNYCALIASGEETGELAWCCEQLAMQQEKALLFSQMIKKTLRYPCFILITCLLVMLLMLIFVLPQFAELYQNMNAQLPFFTQVIIDFSVIIRVYGLYVLFSIMSIVCCYWCYCHKTERWRKREQIFLLRLPIIGALIKTGCLGRFFRTLSMTQRAGISLSDGLTLAVKAVDLLIYQQKILQIQQSIIQGLSFVQGIERVGIFPQIVVQLISAGEASGSLEQMLVKLAELFEQQSDEMARSVMQQLQPFLMLFVGTIVGSLVVALYLPLFQLGNIIK